MSGTSLDSDLRKKFGFTKVESIDGVVIQGHQIASGKASNSPYPDGSIPLQTPFFKKLGLDLSDFYPGTLNISIAPKSFKIIQPDYRFEHVTWIDGFPAETFSFCQCKIWFKDSVSNGYIYYPHSETKTQHFHNDSLIEVICEEVVGIGYGDKVKLECAAGGISIL